MESCFVPNSAKNDGRCDCPGNCDDEEGRFTCPSGLEPTPGTDECFCPQSCGEIVPECPQQWFRCGDEPEAGSNDFLRRGLFSGKASISLMSFRVTLMSLKQVALKTPALKFLSQSL